MSEAVVDKTAMITNVAVYGTLRACEINSRAWEGLANHIPGYIRGFDLRRVDTSWFPIVVRSENPEAIVRVDLLRWHDSECAEMGLRTLDWIEGYPTLYQRYATLVYATPDDREAMSLAWVYQPNDQSLLSDTTIIPEGDWSAYIEEQV